MIGKKGFELSINFIVILILSLVIFIGGIFFTARFFTTASDYKARLDRDTEQQIQNLLSDGSKVAIPFQRKVIKKGTQDVFGLGIMNIGRTKKKFEVRMNFSKAYFPNSSEMAEANSDGYINSNWIFSEARTFQIVPNSFEAVPILVEVKSRIAENVGTTKGTYVFDVCVCSVSCTDSTCSPSEPELYDGYVHKIYVEIP